MAIQLSENVKVKYSDLERQVFNCLPKNGKAILTTDIVVKIYPKAIDEPYYAQQSVTSALRALAKKVKFNKEPFKIGRSEPRGRKPIEAWIEK